MAAREGEAPAAGRTWGGIEFVRVPKGKFIMGSKDDNSLASDAEKPQRTVEIPHDYWIARYPVTNEQFAKFVEATKRKHKWVSDWKSKLDHPVVNVLWHDAMAYCKWLNETLRGEIGDRVIRLPTEVEWEKAARGEYGNEWPWGNEWDSAKCNSKEGGQGDTTPVGAYSPQGDSPYGAADMAGNVWEWCSTKWQKYGDQYPALQGIDEWTDAYLAGDDSRVLRGGSFVNDAQDVRGAFRGRDVPWFWLTYWGFRCVCASGSSSGC